MTISEFFVYDDQHPEDNAMLQALYSRSPESVAKHLEKLKKVGSGKFMDQYYVGYGHQSIGDCGTTTLYIENVSMLAAKAIQDSPLYNGQEASTRYLDMSKQAVVNPLGTPEGRAIQDRWMAFYTYSMSPTIDHLKTVYPIKDGEDAGKYEKAIKARAFDVLRSFLPAGCTTYVSWHTTLRHAADHLDNLRHYPLSEVRGIGETLGSILRERYPHSFGQKRYEASEVYLEALSRKHLYDGRDCPGKMTCNSTIPADLGSVSYDDENLLLTRPPRVRLPHRFDALGQITYKFFLDFGSFRDLQRHRNGVCRMPLVETKWGFHPWYLEQLPDSLRAEAQTVIEQQTKAIDELDTDDVTEKQHYVAMGYKVPCHVTRGLPGTLYLIELRTNKTVHPTMRKVAQDMAETLLTVHPHLPVHADMSPDDWDIRRGGQDIVAR